MDPMTSLSHIGRHDHHHYPMKTPPYYGMNNIRPPVPPYELNLPSQNLPVYAKHPSLKTDYMDSPINIPGGSNLQKGGPLIKNSKPKIIRIPMRHDVHSQKDVYSHSSKNINLPKDLYPPEDVYSHPPKHDFLPKDIYSQTSKDVYSPKDIYPPEDVYSHPPKDDYLPKDIYSHTSKDVYSPKETYSPDNFYSHPVKDIDDYLPKDIYSPKNVFSPKEVYSPKEIYSLPSKDIYSYKDDNTPKDTYKPKDIYSSESVYTPKDIYSQEVEIHESTSPGYGSYLHHELVKMHKNLPDYEYKEHPYYNSGLRDTYSTRPKNVKHIYTSEVQSDF